MSHLTSVYCFFLLHCSADKMHSFCYHLVAVLPILYTADVVYQGKAIKSFDSYEIHLFKEKGVARSHFLFHREHEC